MPNRGAHFVIGLGGSAPDTGRHLAAVPFALADVGLTVVGKSRVFVTPPAGGRVFHPFLNQAVVAAGRQRADTVMGLLLAVERRFGRLRAIKDGPRTLDCDLLWVLSGTGDDVRVQTPRLAVPHPRVHERPFAALPAREALVDAGVSVPAALAAVADPGPSALRPL